MRTTIDHRGRTSGALTATSRAATLYRCAPMSLRKILLATILLGCLWAAPAAQAGPD